MLLPHHASIFEKGLYFCRFLYMSVQQVIISGIRELLFSHNYLVLPGFGGFVLKDSPAHLSASGGLLIPPSKTVSFNGQLKQNDGILAIWLEKKLGCSATESMMHLQEFTQFCSGILGIKRRLNLDGIGFFYLDFESNICFEPLQDANFLTDSFGLGSISIRPFETEITEEKREPVFEDRTEESLVAGPKPVRRNYRRMVYPVMLGFILISLIGLLVSNIKMTGALQSSVLESGKAHYYNPVIYSPLAVSDNEAISNTYVADANGIATLKLDNSKSLAVKVSEGDVIHYGSVTHSSSKKFEIVLGCFAVKANADKMVKKLSKKHIKAFISGQNEKGLFVVSNGSFDNKEKAIDKLQEIKDSFPNAWIKKED